MVYIPDFEPQHDEGLKPPLTNCNPASHAMLIDWYTFGAIDTSDVRIRQASGINPAVGMNFEAINVAIKRLFATQLGGLLYSEANGSGNKQIIWKQLLEHLSRGGGAVVCGNYGDLPTHYRRWSPGFAAGHAAYVQGIPGQALRQWFDPLAAGNAGYGGEPMTDEVLWGFIWTAGSADAAKNFVTASHGFIRPRPTPGRYSDVLATNPHAAAIDKAAELGLMFGIGGGKFGTGLPLTRDQAATLIIRLYNKLNG